MKFNDKVCLLSLMICIMLILSVSLVSASEVDTDAQVISNDDLSVSNSNHMENMVQSDSYSESNGDLEDTGANINSGNGLLTSSESSDSIVSDYVCDADSDKLSSNEVKDGNNGNPIDYHDANGLTLITSDGTIVSDDNYSVVFDWVEEGYYNDYAPEVYSENPWVMNDTIWAYCIEPGPSGPDGYYIGYPGAYKRITLTDEQLIHPRTGEDILPYIMTFIYYHYNDTENFTTSGHGKVKFENVLWSFTDSADYTNPDSHYNRLPYNNPAWTYVKEAIDRVKSGNGIPSSGDFHDTGLTYQFYLYSSVNDYHFQNIIGFNVFTKLDVIKEWDDNDNEFGLRPDNVSVDLYCDGEPVITNVILDSDNNWRYTFNDLPIYSIDKLTEPINENDYEIKTVLEDDFDITITKVWPDDYTNRPSTIYVSIYADGEYLGRVALYRSSGYSRTLTNFAKYGEDGHEINYEITDTSYPGSLDLVKSDLYQVKIITVTLINDDLKAEGKSVELQSDGIILGGAILEESNDWTYTFYNLDMTDSEGQEINYILCERLDSTGVVHIANYTVKESEVPYYISSYENSSSYLNPLYPEQTRFFDSDVENITTQVKITNKLEFVNLTVSKIWNDKDNLYGKRPNNVTINILENGEIIDSVILNEDNGWKYDKILPKYNEGKLIDYSVDEVNITYYHYKVEDDGNNSFTVTNELNKVHVFKWSWKLVGQKEKYYVHDDDKEHGHDTIIKKLPKNHKSNKGVPNKHGKLLGNGKAIGKHNPKIAVPKHKNNNKPKNNNYKGSTYGKNHHEKHSSGHYEYRQKYALFIHLYNQYFFGNMTYDEFLVILEEHGIELNESHNWDSNGDMEFDYDNLEDVPDFVDLTDEEHHVHESSDHIDKNHQADESGVIDSGEVEVDEVDEVYVEE